MIKVMENLVKVIGNGEQNRLGEMISTLQKTALAVLVLLFVASTNLVIAQQCESTPVIVGYRTLSYDASDLTGYPTEEKPESKLWWNDGSWWGVLWDSDLAVHRIHKFNATGQCWTSVGPDVDDRTRSSADVLWDPSEQKLYMSSRAKENHSGASDVWFLRYSYDAGTETYSLDNGFPVSIHDKKSETFVIAKDSNGKFWATWEEDQDIMINRSVGSDDNWGTPFVLPVQGEPVNIDDICSIIAFGGNKIGVMWSNHTQRTMFFAVHNDGDADTSWQPRETALVDATLGSVADDHINLAKSSLDGGQTVLAITKTSLTTVGDPLIFLLKRDSNGVWSRHEFGRVEDDHTRPIVLVNSENDSVYVMAKAKTTPVKGYLKRTHMDNPQFTAGLGELFISSSSDDNMNNPTSTKQFVNSQSGLLVLASDKTSKNYLHNYLDLPSNVPVIESFSPVIGLIGTEVTISGPKFFTGTTEVNFNGTPVASFTVDSDTQLRATVPAGATTGLISLTNAEGTSTSDSPFTVVLTPEVSSFTPSEGPVTSEVTINGNHFIQVSAVSIGGEPVASFSVDSKNQVRVQVASGTTTGAITVTNPAGTGTSASNFTVTGAPNILSVAPSSGIIGSEVTVTGVNFSTANDVSVNGISASSFTVDSDTVLRFDVPAGATTGEIAISNDTGTAQSPEDFVVVLYPVVSSFTPDPGYEGLKITVTGSNFIEIDDVTFAGISATSFTVLSETELRAVVPAAAITGPIGITNAAGTALSSGDLTIIDPPVFKTFAPAHDSRVWSATPTTNYGSLSDLRVRETSTSIINTFLKFDVTGLGGTVGSATLRLSVEDATNDGGTIFTVSNNYEGTSTPWTENGLIWDNAPAIAGTPLSSVGAAAVGEIVEFDLAASIGSDGMYSFGIQNGSSDAVKYQSKEGATAPELVLAVFLSNIPTISSFSPASAPEGGEVIVTGTSFTGTTAVLFNGLPATTFIVDSDTQLRAVVPAGVSDGRIHVTNAEGTGISATDFLLISPPTISGFTPESGIVGAEVTLSGTNLQYVTQVDFNGTVAAAFQVDSESQITVNVPPAALTGAINVTNPAGTAASSSDFSVLYPPVIATFSPDSSAVGSEVTIAGQNFSGSTAVTFDDSSASFTIISDTEIRALVPSVTGAGKIGVTNGDGSDLSSDNFVPILVPMIGSFAPADGPETTLVTITGQNFLQVSGVSFNGVADSSFVVDSPTQIRASVPMGATTGVLGVSNPAGTGVSTQDFTVTFIPLIESFMPIIGIAGTEVTIIGLNFTDTQTVEFNGVSSAAVSVDSDTQLRAEVPVGATSGTITVTNNDGSGDSPGEFTFIDPPAVSSFSPSGGTPGTEITITGSSFVQINEVSFNGVSASAFVVDSETQLRATVPPASSSGPITIGNPAGTANSGTDFTFIAPPATVTFAPIADTFVRSTRPTNNYGDDTELRVRLSSTDYNSYFKFDVTGLGGPVVSAKLRLAVIDVSDEGGDIYQVSNDYLGTSTPWQEDGLIWDNAPAITGSPLSSVGEINLGEIVEFDLSAAVDGEGTYSFAISNNSSDAAKYDPKEGVIAPELVIAIDTSPIPGISSFTPSAGPIGTEVSLIGTNFIGITEVTFNGSSAPNYTVDSDTQIRVEVPAGATIGRITVINSNGSGQSADDFTVILAPVVSGFSPAAGEVGTEVTVTGSGFSGTTDVTFDGVSAAAFSLDSDIQLRAEVTTNATSGLIGVINPAGSTASTDSFTVLYPPVVAAFTPSIGITGTEVTITGAKFIGTSDVRVNGTSASNFTIDSDTQLTATIASETTTGKIAVTNVDGTGLSSEDFVVVQPPTVTSFDPQLGPEGTEVTITGTNFTDATQVSFNGAAAASFAIDSDTQIRATVASGTSSGTISVSNAAGSGQSATNFSVTAPPSIFVFSPTHDSFVRSTEPNKNYGDDDELRVRLSSTDYDTYLKFEVAGLSGTVQSARVRLLVIDGSSSGGDIYEVANEYAGTSTPWEEMGLVWNNAPAISGAPLSSLAAVALGDSVEFDVTPVVSGNGTFSFAITNDVSDAAKFGPKEGVVAPRLVIEVLNSPMPSINSFTPISGPVGTEVTVTGVNFTGASDLAFNGLSAAGINVDSDTQLRAVVPAGATTGAISVTNLDGTGTSASGFTVIDPPVVTSFSPDSAAVGSLVTLSGTGFSGVSDVAFNGTAASSFTIESDSEIRVEVPVGASTGVISVTNSAGTGVSSSDFTVVFIPSVSGFAPANGIVGTEVTITGLNFTGTTDVLFDSTATTGFTVDSDSQLRAAVPPAATTGKISVTNSDGTGISADDFVVIAPPILVSFAPSSGPVGTEVTIAGTSFNNATEVNFNGTNASVFAVDSDSLIRAEVPQGATTGLVTVSNVAGSGSSAEDFTVTFIPSILSFTPTEGALGTEVTVNGVNFTGTTEVAFNGTLAANITVDSDSVLHADVPTGATTGKISVTNSDGTGQSATDFIIMQPPNVASFAPSFGPVGTEITVVGSNLGNVTAVSINGMVATDLAIDSDSQLRASVPSGATSGLVSVTNPGGTTFSSSNFTVTAPPSELIFNPTDDSFVRSTDPTKNYGDDDELRVRLSSTDYDTYLKFDVSGISGSVVSAKIRLLVIDGSPQGGDLYLVSNDYDGTNTPWEEMGLIWNNAPAITGSPLSSTGSVSIGDSVEFDVTSAISGDGIYSFAMTNTVSDAAKYSPKEGSVAPRLAIELLTSAVPSLSSFSPSSGVAGTEVTVLGEHFTGTSSVSFNGLATTNFSVDSDNQLRADVPAGATSGPLSITNPDGTGISSSDFGVISLPVVSSFSPSNGGIGTHVTITGSAFTGVTDVKFNGTSVASFNIVSDSQIQTQVPSEATTGVISVINAAGTGASSTDFAVTFVPFVSGFSPNSGIEGTEVTVAGANFTGTTEVSFNGVSADTFTVDSDAQLRVEVPAAASTGKVTVTNGDGSGPSAEDFVIIQPPTVASFAPSSGPIGSEVTITGADLSLVSDVSFNGASSATFFIDSDTQIRAQVPSGASSGPLNVTNTAGTAASATAFNVTFVPSVTSMTPLSGAVGTEVTLSGINFTGVTDIDFNGVPTTTFTVDADSVLRAEVPVGATTGRISVTNTDGTGESATDFIIIEAPTVDSFTPNLGPIGTEVTVFGSHFATANEVLFNGSPATGLAIDSENQLRATVPAGASSGPISVMNPAGTGASSTDFNVASPPAQLVFNPTDDSFVRSTDPTKNYGDDDELRAKLSSTDYDSYLKFDVSGITGSVVSAKIRLLVIDGSSQGGDLYLVSNDYESTSTPWEEMGLIWNNAPAIGGTPLSSIGSVALGDTAEFDVTSAISDDGIYSFALTSSVSDAAKYDPKEGIVAPRLEIELRTSPTPLISSFSPASAPAGSEVTINGTNLSGATQILFNGTVANFSVDSDVQVRADVPAGSTSGKLSVTTAEGTAQSSNDFTVIQPPSVSSFTPVSGSIGTEVTISGTAFSGVTDVLFNGVSAAAFTLDSDTQLRATVASGATTGPVSIVNVAGTGISGSDFAVTTVPTVASFTPALGAIGTEVTISGVNFSGTTDVSFDDVSASVFTFDSDTQIRAEVPAGATTGKISVTNADGTGQSSDDFTVVQAPTIASFTPASGPSGTEVTIVGSGFLGVTSVTFDGSTASTFAIDSDSQMRATAPAGTTTGPIAVANAAGSATSASDFTVDEPSSLTFNPTDDSFVSSSKPTKNYAGDDELRVRMTSSSEVVSYIKFNVVGLTSAVTSARVRLNVFDASVDGGEIYSVSNNYFGSSTPWEEDGLLWDNAPETTGSPLSSLAAVSVGEIVEFDVTSAIAGNGSYSFAIKNNTFDIVKYSTTEGIISPELVIEFGSSAKRNKAEDVSQLVADDDRAEGLNLPDKLVLGPNYPNPFNIETTIQYSVPKDGKVRVAIYNLRGQEVRNLVDQYQTAGLKKTRWNGRNKSNHEVGTGTYFVHLKFGDKSLTRIITLQK